MQLNLNDRTNVVVLTLERAEDKWEDIMAINLSSVFHATKALLPHMKKQSFGRIVNIASVHGLVGSANKSAYVAAKHGVGTFHCLIRCVAVY